MCKILVMPGVKTDNQEALLDFIKEMGEEMTMMNTDGLGYAAIDTEGKMFGERWHNNREAFDVRNPITELDKNIMEKCLGFLWKEESYDSHGVVNLGNISSLILHTRSATSGKDFCNTHPFVNQNTALIHNGIIRNHEKFDKEVSTCDSEAILAQYLKHNVAENPEAIKDATKPLAGYWACGVLSYSNGEPIVDIFRDKQARLSSAYIKEFNTTVYTTDIDDLMKAAKSCALTVTSVFTVEREKMIRYHALTGDVLGVYEFEGNSSTSVYSGHSSGGHWNGYGNHNHTSTTKKSKHETKKSDWGGKMYDDETGMWVPLTDGMQDV